MNEIVKLNNIIHIIFNHDNTGILQFNNKPDKQVILHDVTSNNCIIINPCGLFRIFNNKEDLDNYLKNNISNNNNQSNIFNFIDDDDIEEIYS